MDEVKGVEFDRVFVVPNGMTQNEKYIAFTRALSNLTIVIDERLDPPKAAGKEKKPDSEGAKPKTGRKHNKDGSIHYGIVVKKKHKKKQ